MQKSRGIRKLLRCLGLYKDGVTTLLALVFVCIGFYQYLEYRSDKKVAAALDILKRRESTIFVNARSTLMAQWFDAKGALRTEFENTDEYTDELLEVVGREIGQSTQYRQSMLHLSAYYSNAAACVLDGYCHAPTICASLAGEIQDFYEVSESYLVYLYRVRKEDALTLILDQPEFVSLCGDNTELNYFSRTDQSLWCEIGRKVYDTTGMGGLASFCEPTKNETITRIVDKASKASP